MLYRCGKCGRINMRSKNCITTQNLTAHKAALSGAVFCVY
nr:MAG TPA: RNAse domain protein [Caudoviricetes sp.]